MTNTTDTTPVETSFAISRPQATARIISWGAIFAGLALFFALSWLMLLLGSALGVGVLDATDLAAIGDGFGIGAAIWLLLTTLVATFAGALLAAKLAGSPSDKIGALHGLTLWAVGTLAVLLLGASGLGGTFSAISGAVASSAEASKQVVVRTTGGDSEGAAMQVPEGVMNSIAATVKLQAAEALSGVAVGENSPQTKDIRAAINSLSNDDVSAIASALVSGEPAQARQRLAQRTKLSQAQIDAIINGAERQMTQWRESEAVQSAEQWLTQQTNELQNAAVGAVSDLGGAQVSSQEVTQALNDLNAETLMTTGRYLISGEPEQAKAVLITRTSLSEQDVEAVVNGAEKEIEGLVNEAQATLNETTEAIGDYTQAVLWSVFIASALGLVAGVAGGYMGAGTPSRVRHREAVAH